jgi:hypothetical protein
MNMYQLATKKGGAPASILAGTGNLGGALWKGVGGFRSVT